MCLAQGHKAVMPVKLEPTTPRSRDKHSTTEPLSSHIVEIKIVTWVKDVNFKILNFGNSNFKTFRMFTKMNNFKFK